MHRPVHAVALPSDVEDFADEIRRVFQELGRAFGMESLAGECSPGIDLYETDETLEVVADLPGVDAASIRLIAKGDGLLIAGNKAARRAGSPSTSTEPPPEESRAGESTFHLVERGYGRFARVVRLGRPCDTARARASMAHGELRISIPKIADRRGRPIRIAIT